LVNPTRGGRPFQPKDRIMPSVSLPPAPLPDALHPAPTTACRRLVAASVVVLLALGGTGLATAPAQADSGDGTAVVWGSSGSVPGSLAGKDVIDISAFDGHNLALTSDGLVTAWGDNASGQTDVPASLADKTVTSVGAGCGFSLALTSDGQITAWGSDAGGRTDVPASLDDKTVTAISAGCGHSLALTSDGHVTAWGGNDSGQSDVPTSLGDQTVIDIDAGMGHSMAVTSEGVITSWGNSTGAVPASLTGKRVIAVAAGMLHSVALTSDGQVTAWGDNGLNQTSVPPLNGQTVIEIEAGIWHSLALTSEGKVLAWGHNGQCQLCVPALPPGTGYTAIAVGHLHSLGVQAPLPIDFTNGTAATITGTPQVGQTLTAEAGDVTPAPTSYSYRWFADGTVIPAATRSALVLTASHQGAAITVQVTSLRHGYNDSTDASPATTPVVGTTVSGTTTVGHTLRGSAAAITMYGNAPLAKQWLREGAPIPDATDATYVLTNADAGSTIAFQVTGTQNSVSDAPVISAAVGPVSGGVITLPAPVVTGTPVVDGTLSAALPENEVDPADADVTWQWLRGGTRVATGNTYTPDPDDLGAVLSVRATATKDFFNRVSRAADTAPVALATFGTPPVATISGTVKVGEVLSAGAGAVTPAPDDLAYQWFSDGSAIDGATQQLFKVTAAQRYTPMTVGVTASRDGYQDASDVSDPTAEVATDLAPDLQFDEGDSTLRRGQSTMLTWTSGDADSVVASGDWTGSKALSGSTSVSPTRIGANTYVLEASNANGSTTTQVTVTVTRQATLLAVSSPSGLRRAGTIVPVTTGGLDAGEGYTIRIGETQVATGTATSAGSLTRTVAIPSRTKDGVATVTVTGSESDRAGRTGIRVITNKTLGIRLAKRVVRIRHRQAVTVFGLASGEHVTVLYRGRRVSSGSARANDVGAYLVTFHVGKRRGLRNVTVTGQFPSRTATTSFRVRRP
jgi:hypothetical protein